MTFDVRDLTTISSLEDFYRIAEQSPGMVKGRAGWELGCQCGQPECFANMFCKFYNDPFTEPEDIEVLISRWEAMTIIIFDTFDLITKTWIEEYRPLRQYRCYLAIKTAMTEGPGAIFDMDGVEVYISPDCPPPEDVLEAMREEIGSFN